jgi:hypothetical protein
VRPRPLSQFREHRGAIAVSVVLALVLTGLAEANAPGAHGSAATVAREAPGTGVVDSVGHGAQSGTDPFLYNTVPFTTTINSTTLAYEEWLPPAFDNASTYPLMVFLQGSAGESTVWTAGGVTSQIILDLNETDWEGTDLQDIIRTGTADGYIIITVNERTGAGFFANSLGVCAANNRTVGGGPQENDTLNAIESERSRHRIGQIFLLGFNMGSAGALALAASNPGMFASVATAGTITDVFSAFFYRQANLDSTNSDLNWTNASYATMLNFTCHVTPSPTNTSVDAIYDYLSPLRLDPTAFANVPLYVVSGGLDARAPNDAEWSDYLNVNDTFVESTCQTFPGEPANCTIPLAALHRAHPTEYKFRDIYEPSAGDTYGQFNATDVFAWFAGTAPEGFYQADHYPATEIFPVRPSGLELGPAISASVSAPAGLPGKSYIFSANASGLGGPSFTYAWSFGDGGNASGAVVTHTFAAAGNYTVNVTTVGTGGLTNTTDLSFLVTLPLTTSIGLSVAQPAPFQFVELTANTVGGFGPYVCQWSFGDGSPVAAGSCNVSHGWLALGTYRITVSVLDHAGDTASNSTVLTIVPPPPGESQTPLERLTSWPHWRAALIGLALVGVILAAVVIYRRRSRPPLRPSPQVWQTPGATPSIAGVPEPPPAAPPPVPESGT